MKYLFFMICSYLGKNIIKVKYLIKTQNLKQERE